MVDRDDGESDEDVLCFVRNEVAAGFADRDEVITATVDYFEDEAGAKGIASLVPAMVDAELQAHRKAQLTWPAITDCDRLDAAFDALEAGGIVARQNFSCCGTCGSAEIWDEIAVARDAGLPAHGYAFYHIQDTENAAGGYGLHLNYGATDEGEAEALRVGNAIFATLIKSGLKTEWDGTWDKRIGVSLDWKRRRAG